MNEFQTLRPWPDKYAEEAAAADRDDVALKTNEGFFRQDTHGSSSPSKLVTIDLLESLSHNPSNIGLLFEVAKAELESIDTRLALQVARCAELEEEQRAADDRYSDDEGIVATVNEEIETLKAKVKEERRGKLDLGVQMYDLKKELSNSRDLLEAQDLELARDEEASRSVKEERAKEVEEMQTRLEESQKQLQELREKYDHQAIELQEAVAMRDNPWVEHERVRFELKEARSQLKAAKTIQKTLETDVDAAQTTIVEISSQLERELDELERLRSMKSRHDEDQARKLEEESAMHEELSATCDEQASQIVRLEALLAEKDEKIKVLRDACSLERMKQDVKEPGDWRRKDMEKEIAKSRAETVSALTLLNEQTAKLQRANAEREMLRANAENERNEKMARLKSEYRAVASARAANHRRDGCPIANRLSGLASRRNRKVGTHREMSDEEEIDGRAIIDLDCVDDSVCARAEC